MPVCWLVGVCVCVWHRTCPLLGSGYIKRSSILSTACNEVSCNKGKLYATREDYNWRLRQRRIALQQKKYCSGTESFKIQFRELYFNERGLYCSKEDCTEIKELSTEIKDDYIATNVDCIPNMGIVNQTKGDFTATNKKVITNYKWKIRKEGRMFYIAALNFVTRSKMSQNMN